MVRSGTEETDKVSDPIQVKHNEPERRFEVQAGDDLAVLEYRKRGHSIVFTHTGVPPALEGGGIGRQLVRAGLEYAREQGLQVVPMCSFVAAYVRRHREYLDLVPDEYRAKLEAKRA
jgi:predicted GNAT family acetyltransferase